MPRSIEKRAYELVGILRSEYEVFAKHYPLTKSIKDELIAEIGDKYPKRIINKALSVQTRTISYIRKLLRFKNRFNLKKERCETITKQEKECAFKRQGVILTKDKEMNYAFRKKNQKQKSPAKVVVKQKRTFTQHQSEAKTQCIIKPKRRVLSLQK